MTTTTNPSTQTTPAWAEEHTPWHQAHPTEEHLQERIIARQIGSVTIDATQELHPDGHITTNCLQAHIFTDIGDTINATPAEIAAGLLDLANNAIHAAALLTTAPTTWHPVNMEHLDGDGRQHTQLTTGALSCSLILDHHGHPEEYEIESTTITTNDLQTLTGQLLNAAQDTLRMILALQTPTSPDPTQSPA